MTVAKLKKILHEYEDNMIVEVSEGEINIGWKLLNGSWLVFGTIEKDEINT